MSGPDQFATELTPIGEQFVIPGCERKTVRPGQQMNLWGNAPPPKEAKGHVVSRCK